jgi:hypothetical protein
MKQELMHYLNEKLSLRRKFTSESAELFWQTFRQTAFSLPRRYTELTWNGFDLSPLRFRAANDIALMHNFIKHFTDRLEAAQTHTDLFRRVSNCLWLTKETNPCCDRANICPFCWWRHKVCPFYEDLLQQVLISHLNVQLFVLTVKERMNKKNARQLLAAAQNEGHKLNKRLCSRNVTHWHRICVGGTMERPVMQLRILYLTSDQDYKRLRNTVLRSELLHTAFERMSLPTKQNIRRMAGDYFAYPVYFIEMPFNNIERLLKTTFFKTRSQVWYSKNEYSKNEYSKTAADSPVNV